MKRWWLGAAIGSALAASATGALAVSGSDPITTFAGTGTAGFAGDGGPATSAQLNFPRGVAVDEQGNVYIADTQNHRVRRVSGGTITTIAGTGTAGFSGDGGQATSAQLNAPLGVAVDGQGNVYVADRDNHRVRRVTVSGGTIATIAGTGTRGFSGDGGQAISAQLNIPVGVAVDGQGNVYVADAGNHRVRRVSGGTITTIAGTGKAGFSGDGGPATAAQLNAPLGVAVDGRGNVYIADTTNHRLRRVSGGGISVPRISTHAGTGAAGFAGDGGPATAAQLNAPFGVAVDRQGTVYIGDRSNHRVRRVSGGTITTIAGTGTPGFSGEGGPAVSAQLTLPAGVAVDRRGSLYVADTFNKRVRVVANAAPTASFTATPASGQAPLPVSFDASGSSDPNGSIASYSWAFGDGATASGRTTAHTYQAAGSFAVKLTVTDDAGATASAERTITVAGPAGLPPPASTARCAGQRATIVGTPGRDVIRGTRRRDVIAALGGADVIRGLGGNDLVCGGAGNDTIHGGAGADTLHGQAGADRIFGGPGGDRLFGGPGADRLSGGPGRDRLAGGPGKDVTKQ